MKWFIEKIIFFLKKNPNNKRNTHEEITRGGGSCRAVDASILLNQPLTRGRVYSEEELWDNFSHLMKKVLPVAEEVGVKLGTIFECCGYLIS